MSKSAPSPKQDTSDPGFEAALARLEAIVEEMESGSLSLDDLLAKFEEGRALSKKCGDKLESVERKIRELVEEDNELKEIPREEGTEKE